jgi:YD repeat-containing protein
MKTIIVKKCLYFGVILMAWALSCAGAGAITYSYDDAGRLVAADYKNRRIFYTYDNNGNLLTMQVQTDNSSQPQQYTLTLNIQGSGTITSNPAGIDCGSICTAAFPDGTVVNLTATPNTGWDFSGWSGDCSGSSTIMNANRSCTANFTTSNTGGGGTGNTGSGNDSWSDKIKESLGGNQ